jgi:hypothetical protein
MSACRAAIFAAGAPDAPLANDNDSPAAPNNGTAVLRRFRFADCFVCDIAETPVFAGILTIDYMRDAISGNAIRQLAKKLEIARRSSKC